MSTPIEKKWRCNDCYEIHDSEDHAVDCCPVDVRAVFVCPHCAVDYCTELEADECRDGHDEERVDFVRPPPTAAELEAAGQQRLAI